MDEARDNVRGTAGDFVSTVRQVTVARVALGYEAVELRRIATH
ncbi:hypothetical protein GGC65_001464 [Sphingopyxis sp. OAS728]|nr:hypothetical protein [Sphingopyxis sp. OAS728]MBE1527008.1 hypothetical protein [Sphingopyxis sp. OAS728]